MKEAPIGVFDSGIGGLTVAHALKEVLPLENIVYFGDSAHLPYGDKSEESVVIYAKKICSFLLAQNCKAIIIACNTASAYAFEILKDLHPNVLIIDVISPMVDHLVAQDFNTIGIIGTKGTTQSKIYPKKIAEKAKNIQVKTLATPLLVPMIEEQLIHNNISREIIKNYLDTPKLKGIEALVLACTHYPLIKSEIAEISEHKFHIFQSAEIVASHVKSVLTDQNLLSEKQGEDAFYVSDYTDSFDYLSKFFFGDDINLREFRLWD